MEPDNPRFAGRAPEGRPYPAALRRRRPPTLRRFAACCLEGERLYLGGGPAVKKAPTPHRLAARCPEGNAFTLGAALR
jgi:hypothetical protein